MCGGRWHDFDFARVELLKLLGEHEEVRTRVAEDFRDVDALREAVQAAYPKLSHRYYAMKAKWLGLEQLEYWDRNAPLPETDDRTVPWTEARKIVLEAYSGFAPKMAELAEHRRSEEKS